MSLTAWNRTPGIRRAASMRTLPCSPAPIRPTGIGSLLSAACRLLNTRRPEGQHRSGSRRRLQESPPIQLSYPVCAHSLLLSHRPTGQARQHDAVCPQYREQELPDRNGRCVMPSCRSASTVAHRTGILQGIRDLAAILQRSWLAVHVSPMPHVDDVIGGLFLQPAFHFIQTDCSLFAPFRLHRQIVQVFQQRRYRCRDRRTAVFLPFGSSSEENRSYRASGEALTQGKRGYQTLLASIFSALFNCSWDSGSRLSSKRYSA